MSYQSYEEPPKPSSSRLKGFYNRHKQAILASTAIIAFTCGPAADPGTGYAQYRSDNFIVSLKDGKGLHGRLPFALDPIAFAGDFIGNVSSAIKNYSEESSLKYADNTAVKTAATSLKQRAVTAKQPIFCPSIDPKSDQYKKYRVEINNGGDDHAQICLDLSHMAVKTMSGEPSVVVFPLAFDPKYSDKATKSLTSAMNDPESCTRAIKRMESFGRFVLARGPDIDRRMPNGETAHVGIIANPGALSDPELKTACDSWDQSGGK